VHSGKLGEGFLDELPQLFRREAVLSSDVQDARAVLLYVPEQPRFTSSPDPGWQVTPLVLGPCAGFSPYSDAQCAMAMGAVS
jgi:hypothetical protein